MENDVRTGLEVEALVETATGDEIGASGSFSVTNVCIVNPYEDVTKLADTRFRYWSEVELQSDLEKALNATFATFSVEYEE